MKGDLHIPIVKVQVPPTESDVQFTSQMADAYGAAIVQVKHAPRMKRILLSILAGALLAASALAVAWYLAQGIQ